VERIMKHSSKNTLSYPKKFKINAPETITLCRNCYKKLYYIYSILSKYLNIDVKEEYMIINIEQSLRDKILKYIEKHSIEDKETPREEIIKEFTSKGYKEDEIEDTIDELECEGLIYPPTTIYHYFSSYISMIKEKALKDSQTDISQTQDNPME